MSYFGSRITRISSIIGAVSALGCVVGCSSEEDRRIEASNIATNRAVSEIPIVGEVIKESYTPEIAVHGFGRVNVSSKYTLTVKKQDGKIIIINVRDGYNLDKESLDLLISPGKLISFPRGSNSGLWNELNYGSEFTSQTQVGEKPSNLIKILN